MQTITTIPKTYVEGWLNWLFPPSVSLTAIPNPLIAIIDILPTLEQMLR